MRAQIALAQGRLSAAIDRVVPFGGEDCALRDARPRLPGSGRTGRAQLLISPDSGSKRRIEDEVGCVVYIGTFFLSEKATLIGPPSRLSSFM